MSPDAILYEHLTAILGARPRRLGPLTGGCVGEVYRVEMPGGETFVAKVDGSPDPVLAQEAFMLHYLAEHSRLPVPTVIQGSDDLLVLEFVPGESAFSTPAQEHAAKLLADLHGISAPAYGLEQDDLIGGLRQPNPWTDSWVAFFRDQRLRYMGQEALEAGRLPERVYDRLDRFAGRLHHWLPEPEHPSLIHGDVWTTNILAAGDRITGFLDPAIYYADPEIELAFITLFNSFGKPFFKQYSEIRPIHDEFWQKRKDIYNLYPLLVHVRLFGGGYVAAVERTLSRFGF